MHATGAARRRDQRVRVSVVPADPLAGAHEIQSFCLGHTSFVTCSAFTAAPGGDQVRAKRGRSRGGRWLGGWGRGTATAGVVRARVCSRAAARPLGLPLTACCPHPRRLPQELLATGGGDGTLRLWDPLTGTLLHTLELPPLPEAAQAAAEAEQQQQEQPAGQQDAAAAPEEDAGASGSSDEGEGCEGKAAAGGEGAAAAAAAAAAAETPVPLAMAAAPCGGWLVVAVDGRDELCLVRVDRASRSLHEAGWFALPGLHLPACLAFEPSGRLWAAGGPVADDSTAAFVACGSVAAGEQPALAPAGPPDWLPAEALERLQAQTGGEAAALAAAAERRRLACQLLRKRQYSLQQLEQRKRRRRDRVAKAEAERKAAEAAAAAGAGQE